MNLMKILTRTEIARRLKAMKAGQQFSVLTPQERMAVNQLAKDFYRAGFMDVQVFTKRQDDGTFLVVASAPILSGSATPRHAA